MHGSKENLMMMYTPQHFFAIMAPNSFIQGSSSNSMDKDEASVFSQPNAETANIRDALHKREKG